MVEKYYKDVFSFNGRFSTEVRKDIIGYGMAEHEDCVLNMKLIGDINVSSETIHTTVTVTNNDLKNAITYFFSDSDLDVFDIKINSGVKQECNGFGMIERTTYESYYTGVNVRLKNNIKKGEFKK